MSRLAKFLVNSPYIPTFINIRDENSGSYVVKTVELFQFWMMKERGELTEQNTASDVD